jgi:formamidopyrimidine-DNA glycosylase
MPEGPEILISSSYLNKFVKGKNFIKITSNTKTKRDLPKKSKVINVYSFGKIIIIETKDYFVHVHFGITGWLVRSKPRIYKYILHFGNYKFYLQDRRRFSSIKILNEDSHNNEINKLGIDILSDNFTFLNFINLTKNKKQNICSFLLDQKKFSGLGNYIKNEVLYLSKVSPFRKVNNLSDKELKIIYDNIRFVSFSNVVDWFKEYKIKLPDKIKKLLPKKLEVPYNFHVYEREYDDFNNKVIFNKTHCGRRTFYVKEVQK